MEDREMGHRKFLKSPDLTYELGAFLPQQVELYRGQSPIDLSWLSHTKFGSVLFFLSSHCKVCNSKAVIQAINKYPKFSYIIFYEGSNTTVEDQEESLLESGVKLHSFHMNLLEKNLKVYLLPYQLVLNRVGQVISSGIINNLPMIDALMMPLVRSVENSKK